MTIFLKNKHTLQMDDFYFKCSIGKKGVTRRKKKGDKKHLWALLQLEIYFIEKIE